MRDKQTLRVEGVPLPSLRKFSKESPSARPASLDPARFFAAYPLETIVHRKLSEIITDMTGATKSGLYQYVMEMVERPMIQLTLEHTDGNQCKAADLLGINRNTLRKKISSLGIDPRVRKP